MIILKRDSCLLIKSLDVLSLVYRSSISDSSWLIFVTFGLPDLIEPFSLHQQSRMTRLVEIDSTSAF